MNDGISRPPLIIVVLRTLYIVPYNRDRRMHRKRPEKLEATLFGNSARVTAVSMLVLGFLSDYAKGFLYILSGVTVKAD